MEKYEKMLQRLFGYTHEQLVAEMDAAEARLSQWEKESVTQEAAEAELRKIKEQLK